MQHYDTTIIQKGQHLHFTERFFIEKRIALGDSNREIARLLDRPHSTVNNEIKRGTIKQIKIVNGQRINFEQYDAYAAQGFYYCNRERSIKGYKLARVSKFIEYAVKKIRYEKWSPDAVVGYVLVQGLFTKDDVVSAKTLYNYINLKVIDLTNFDLLRKLSFKTREQKPNANVMILGKSIEVRPEHINNRSEFGHWEIDTVIGIKDRNEPVLLTLTERQTRFELILKIDGKTEADVKRAIKPLMNTPLSKEIFKSITADNGLEFSSLTDAVKSTAEVYFTHPYSSWERGTNENHNGIIRRFIPKGIKISTITETTIRRINVWMNNYPRKIFGYHTPFEMFNEKLEPSFTT